MLVAALMAAFVIGCGDKKDGEDKGTKGTDSSAGAVDNSTRVSTSWCSCGHEKGAEDCCSRDAERCNCGMIKGSPLCCVEIPEEMKGKEVCSCGFAKGAEECCAKDSERCNCGMIKGSPMCCKLKKDDDHGHKHEGGDHDHDHDHDHDEKGGHDKD